MIKKIRENKLTKIIASYLALMIFIQVTQPLQLYALTEGPSQPEFNSFTPIGTSDMVDLTSGDFNYNIPVMDVGGYPINLAYNSGVTMDQEASWVGLGWNLNIGQINRNVRGLPDDFKGDTLHTVNNIKTNVTVGVNPYFNFQVFGLLDNGPSLNLGAGLDVQYNNYSGMSATPSFGASFKMSNSVSVGMQLSSSAEEGVSITPSVSLSTGKMKKDQEGSQFNAGISPSITYNSRQGLQSFNLSSTMGYQNQFCGGDKMRDRSFSSSGSGSISLLNNTFTPTKRTGFKNNNIRFSFSGGPDLWGFHGEISIAGYASVQKLADKVQFQKSYGYENTGWASESDMLDFNREKEQAIISKNTLVLPVTNYTYDLYTIQGQGIGGMFRPFRGQVGQVFDAKVVDQSASNSFGFEIEGGGGVHKGLNFRTSHSNTYTGNWQTVVNPFLQEKMSGNAKDYENVYYKNIGETRVDKEYGTLLQNLGGSSPITLEIDRNKNAINKYRAKILANNESLLSSGVTFNSQIKRNHREKRNQVVQKLTKLEVQKYDLSPFFTNNQEMIQNIPLVPSHHTAGYIITDESSNRHIYGETVYNKEKKEVTFNAGNRYVSQQNGLVIYSGSDNSSNNSNGRDNYFNSVRTPAYAHTYLLSSVLSSDYEDLTSNGPSDDDLGTYTKFSYENKGNYNWRVPFGKNEASYNEGLKTDKLDQKGSYIYGIKENKYLKKIETKTHVAFIDLEERQDGFGVDNEDGGNVTGENKMYRIKSIRLYSKPEAILANLLDSNPANDNNSIQPIKTAHFEYNYSLCPGIDNNLGSQSQGNGKLTLKKVYFTYRGSNMGKYTPYVFTYSAYNPDYNAKAYDIWGNYKPYDAIAWNVNSPVTTPQEFPYVEQSDRNTQNDYAKSWLLESIQLPSGGKINVEFEADDYQYVQDKKAMQMFKVDGVTSDINSYPSNKNKLYLDNNVEAKYVVINVPEYPGENKEQIIRRYTEGLRGKSVYFNFLMNMTSNDYDYVSGYFEMHEDPILSDAKDYLFIPMRHVNQEGKSSGATSNPISVAGWFFGRQNLNLQINGLDDPGGSIADNVVNIGRSIANNLGSMLTIFKGANKRLKENLKCAKLFKPEKSWIRLLEPTGSKIGGGSRVKKIVLNDEWQNMVDIENTNDARYAKQYGQEYDYSLDDKTSSGVATYEPNISKENPLIEPYYHKPERLTAQAYQEKPFGESFFPAPTVTYSKVTVKNITASGNPTKSGKVVTQHFTSRDFPTITDFTNLDKSNIFQTNEDEMIKNMLKGLLGLKVEIKTDLTMSQGFVIETNDMNGKLKKQEVFNNANSLISSVEYKYSTKGDNEKVLENKLPTIDENGNVNNNLEIATHYDVINDLRESYSGTSSFGMSVNLDYIPLGFIPIIIGFGLPERSDHKQILRTAVTTKVIHKSGILKEKIAFDLGSRVSTKNEAWDANTGQVLLTETINEFNDKYYNLNYPAYWYYKAMGMASENIDVTGKFRQNPIAGPNGERFFTIDGINTATDISNLLKPGDEILMLQPNKKFWVYGYNSQKSAVTLMNSTGVMVQSFNTNSHYNLNFRVIRSGVKNQQMASMASITLMKNPLKYNTDGTGKIDQDLITMVLNESEDPRIVNASAIEYNDYWQSQCENGLPAPNQQNVNHYLYNIKGEWRPVNSYAYLTGRNAMPTSDIRKSGYFKAFNPFYKVDTILNRWAKDYSNWTFASEVTKYNPYGVEVENKDALGRYSSAQYGYKYKLPIAVASNSEYREMGFDGFEDYDRQYWEFGPLDLNPHFGFLDYNEKRSITELASHTGKRSVLITSGHLCSMIRPIEGNVDSNSRSFILSKEKKYIVSGWMKMVHRDSLSDNIDVESYANLDSDIRVSFLDNNEVEINGSTLVASPKGNIIDGWQRISEEFIVPINASKIVIVLNSQVHNSLEYNQYLLTFFDDVRVLPAGGNLKSFVYDQDTHRLMAELDENNYATFYEYDKEGGLVRVKKETEKGVFTIQETRSSNKKTAQ